MLIPSLVERRTFRTALVVGVCLWLTSTERIQRSIPAGHGLELAVLLTVGALAYIVFAFVVLRVVRPLNDRTASWLLAILSVGAVLAFIVGHTIVGPGYADTDDALDILADSLVEGFNPYQQRTFLDNTISPMMGAGVLALPFRIAFGISAYQNPFWVLAGAYVLHRAFGARIALVLATFTLSSLGFVADYLFGGDYYVSGIVLAIAAGTFLHGVQHHSPWRYVAAVFFGVAVTTRLSTLPVLVLVAAVLYGIHRRRDAAGPLALATAVSVSLWLPWWLADPGSYAPLSRGSFVGPTAAQALVAVLFLIVLILAATRTMSSDEHDSPVRRMARYAPLIALALISVALIWTPGQIHRVAPFLMLGFPGAAPHMAAALRR